MSVNRKDTKWWECVRVKKKDKNIPLEIFHQQGRNRTMVLNSLRKRFFLKKDEEWIMTRKRSMEKDYVGERPVGR